MVHRLVCLDINARMTSPPGFGRQFFVLGTVYKSSSKSNLAADGLVSTCFLGIGLNSPLRVTAYTVIPAHGIRHNVKRDGICFEKKKTIPVPISVPFHATPPLLQCVTDKSSASCIACVVTKSRNHTSRLTVKIFDADTARCIRRIVVVVPTLAANG